MKKSDIQRIEDISRELTAGLELLMSDSYQIMRPTTLTSADVFTSPYYPGKKYHIITKEIGNALVPMFSAIKSLKELLEKQKGGDNELRNNLLKTVHQPAIDRGSHSHDSHRQQ